MRSTLVLIVAIVGSLGACVPYQERVAQTCSSMGYMRGTAAFSGCMERQMQADQAERAMWLGVAGAGAQMMSQPQYQQPIITNTNCSPFGQTLSCTSVTR